MSFAGRIKEELAEQNSDARHCQLAELAAIAGMCGILKPNRETGYELTVHTENISVTKKVFTLLKKTFNIKNDIIVRVSVHRNTQKDNRSYNLVAQGESLEAIQNVSVQAVCCKRAFLRGAFLASGSVSDPRKSYHFEIVCEDDKTARYIQYLMSGFQLDAKIVQRKKNYVVYLKEGEQIVDMLNVMGAHVALMELENVRILKEMRNAVNRKVNCETANINKTVSAAVKQIEDITFIQETVGLEDLPKGLKDVALTRLAYPEAALKELGELLEEPVGKSGVNHRLRKLSEIADKIREN